MTPERIPVSQSRSLPLSGFRVLDFGQAIQAPYAGFLLAMAGAEVIKVEPITGEMSRNGGPAAEYAFELLNSSKQGLSVNLKDPEGQALVLELSKRADVVVENFAPGVMDRLNVGSARLLAANPKLVYATGTGYGLTGPMRDRVAMDAAVQAVSGLTLATGAPDGMPMRAGLPVADFLAGTHLYAGIVTALVDVQRTGVGRVVEVSMLESMFPLQTMNLSLWHRNGRTQAPPRIGNAHGAVGPHNIYRALDGWVAILCATDRQWHALATAMGSPQLADQPEFKTSHDRVFNREALDRHVTAWTEQLTRERVCRLCEDNRVPAAPVRDTVEVLNDDHLRSRGYLSEIDHPTLGPTTLANSAMRFADSSLRAPTRAPRLGEHTDELLTALGRLSPEAIADLHRKKIVA